MLSFRLLRSVQQKSVARCQRVYHLLQILQTLARTHKIKKRTEKWVPQLPYHSVLTPADFFLPKKVGH